LGEQKLVLLKLREVGELAVLARAAGGRFTVKWRSADCERIVFE
jgi:hypothetical protein